MSYTPQSKQDINSRKHLLTFGELLDRLSIYQLKEVFITDHKDEYKVDIGAILHDLDLILQDKNFVVDAKTLRALIVLAQMNTHIWYNETNYRACKEGEYDLELTHGLNGIRNTAKNIIEEKCEGRQDYKVDCLAAEFKDWEISW
ncbi:MAG: hypothetical protein H8E03_01050 [Pelagibacteraceae bacterium]|nr:hypothetical protein [Pelagibacteraceae bacterium]